MSSQDRTLSRGRAPSIGRLPYAAVLVGLLVTHPAAAEDLGALFVMRPDGSEVRKVVAVEGHTDHGAPRWSNDSKRICFQARIGNGERSCFVVNADGSGLQELARGRVPNWSPDDKQIVFQANAASPVFVQNLDGTGRTQITTGYSPRWGPEGELLALSDRQQLRVLNLLSGEETSVFGQQSAHVFDGFDWSPDGRRLAVVTRPQEGADRELLVVDAGGNNPRPRRLAQGGMGGYVAFSPDGRQVIYADGWRLHLVDADGKGQTRLVPGQKGKNRHPDWSPDGKWIAFVSTREDAK